jgi:hypothetical protein
VNLCAVTAGTTISVKFVTVSMQRAN